MDLSNGEVLQTNTNRATFLLGVTGSCRAKTLTSRKAKREVSDKENKSLKASYTEINWKEF